jgi:hypothetical protein
MIYLSGAAATLRDQTMEMANQTLNEALGGVSTEEIEMCKSVLQRVYDNLK